jgi:hypothetical protein
VLTHETVGDSTRSITEVRGTSELLPDGTFHVKTEHLRNGAWEPGHEVVYKEDSSAKVIFK